jgi:Phosphomethylpyrimidine kinase
MRTVLSIAGFDPSGGAGVLADIKTFAASGCFGVAAITSLTYQNTLGRASIGRLPAGADRTAAGGFRDRRRQDRHAAHARNHRDRGRGD